MYADSMAITRKFGNPTWYDELTLSLTLHSIWSHPVLRRDDRGGGGLRSYILT